MRTPLSELANANELRGPVCVTCAKGITTTYDSEDKAWDAVQGKKLEHRRGAFFEVAAAAPAAPVVLLDDDDEPRRSKKKKRSSSDS